MQKTQNATSFATRTISFEQVLFNGKPSAEDRDALKAVNGFARMEGETWVWYIPAGEAGKAALAKMGAAYLARQTPPVVKVTTGSAKTVRSKANADATAKAYLVEKLAAQGKSREEIAGYLSLIA